MKVQTKWMLLVWCLLLIGVVSWGTARAEDKAKGKASEAAQRTKSIDFEGDVVEGLNKNPMDALEHTATKDDRDKPHLYRKKEHFRNEMKQNVRDMGFRK